MLSTEQLVLLVLDRVNISQNVDTGELPTCIHLILLHTCVVDYYVIHQYIYESYPLNRSLVIS